MRRFNLVAAGSARADVGQAVGAQQIAARLYELGAGEESNPYHFHHGVEEWLLVVAGAPVVRAPDGERALQRGDVLCFPAGDHGGHQVRGPGRVLILSERRALDVIEYPDSGTFELRPPGTILRPVDAT